MAKTVDPGFRKPGTKPSLRAKNILLQRFSKAQDPAGNVGLGARKLRIGPRKLIWAPQAGPSEWTCIGSTNPGTELETWI